MRVGRRARNGLARAHGEAVGTACRLRCDAREPGPRQNSLRASRCAQTTAASQITKQACPSAGLRPGPLRFSPPRKSPTPGHSSRADTGRSIGRHEGCGLPVAVRGHGRSHAIAATMLEACLASSGLCRASTSSARTVGGGDTDASAPFRLFAPRSSLFAFSRSRVTASLRHCVSASVRQCGSAGVREYSTGGQFRSGRGRAPRRAPVRRREAQRARPQACRRTGLLRDLTRGVCLSGAAVRQRSELCRGPGARASQGSRPAGPTASLKHAAVPAAARTGAPASANAPASTPTSTPTPATTRPIAQACDETLRPRPAKGRCHP